MNANIIFETVCNGHRVTVYSYNGYKSVYVSNEVRDEMGGLFDLAAFRDYDGYPVERGFSNAADALHYARMCVVNAKKPFE